MFKEEIVIPIYTFPSFFPCPVILRSLQSETFLIAWPVPKAHFSCTHHLTSAMLSDAMFYLGL